MLIFHTINGTVGKIMVVARFRLHNNKSLLNYELPDVVIFRVGLELFLMLDLFGKHFRRFRLILKC